MARSVFNGDSPGATDLSYFFFLISAVYYFYFSRERSRLSYQRIRPFLGFVVFSAFFASQFLVFSVKWMWGRARPHQVLSGKLPFSHWYEFGPQSVSDGIFYGSFPSGHTATIFFLITFSYFLIADRARSKRSKMAGLIWTVAVLALTGMMIVGRSMTRDHWVTDTVGVCLLSWICIHLIYYEVLKIPAQNRYVDSFRAYPPLPRYWEISLLWRLLFITIGLMSVVIGTRAIFIDHTPWLALIIFPGLALVFIFSKNLLTCYRSLMIPFRPFTDKSDSLPKTE